MIKTVIINPMKYSFSSGLKRYQTLTKVLTKGHSLSQDTLFSVIFKGLCKGSVFSSFKVEDDDDGDNLPQMKKESELPFVPNYLANPAFPFIYTPVAEDSAPLQNGGPSMPAASPPADGSPPLLPPEEPPLLGAFPRDHPSLALVQNGDVSAPSAILRTPESTKPGPVCQPPVSQSRSLFSAVPSKPPVSMEPQNGTCTGPAPAFQPFFFTGAFPFNMQGNPSPANSLCTCADNIQRSGAFLPGLGEVWDFLIHFECNYRFTEKLQDQYKELSLLRFTDYLLKPLPFHPEQCEACVFPESKGSL